MIITFLMKLYYYSLSDDLCRYESILVYLTESFIWFEVFNRSFCIMILFNIFSISRVHYDLINLLYIIPLLSEHDSIFIYFLYDFLNFIVTFFKIYSVKYLIFIVLKLNTILYLYMVHHLKLRNIINIILLMTLRIFLID